MIRYRFQQLKCYFGFHKPQQFVKCVTLEAAECCCEYCGAILK